MKMKENLRNWIGTIGALAVIGALTLGSVPSMAKGQKPASRPAVLVTKTDSRISATHSKKAGTQSAATQAKKEGGQAAPAARSSKKASKQDSAAQPKKAPKASKAKVLEGSKVNINTASAEELAKLPRVGAKAAQRIVDYRSAHKSFKSVDELRNVKGIGPKVFEGIRPYATL
jgi:comEA protein